MDVGIRELKAKLSEYVAAAASGEHIVVTDRGRPVAQLVGLTAGSSIDRGIEEGWIEAPRRTGLPKATRHKANRSIQSALDDDRG